jgi:ATP-dependent RNA helicase DDX10/DBP4
VLRKLRPGIPLLALYGKQNQLKRVGVYERFVSTPNAALFATDIAARGLDFPSVNWVIQLDCPEDANAYIHRVGRTARYQKGGQALLLLLSSELAMVECPKEKKIPIHEINVNPKKCRSIQGKLQAFCAQNQDIKLWAQKSIVSYTRSVYLQSNKKVFDVHKLPIEEYAASLGLLVPPRIRFMKKLKKKVGPSEERKMKEIEEQKLGIELLTDRFAKDEELTTINDDTQQTKNQKTKPKKKSVTNLDNESEEEDLLVTKQGKQQHDMLETDKELNEISTVVKARKPQSKVAMAKKLLRKDIKLNSKIVFDTDGQGLEVRQKAFESDDDKNEELEPVSLDAIHKAGGIDIDSVMSEMKDQDVEDRQVERLKVKEKHRDLRLKEKLERKAASIGAKSTAILLSDGGDGEIDSGLQGLLDRISSGESSEEEEISQPQTKKSRKVATKMKSETKQSSPTPTTSDFSQDEAMALHLLGVT